MKHGNGFKDISGRTVGRWYVMHFVKGVIGGSLWHCRCDCGTEKDILSNALRRGTTQSCGCYNRERSAERITHGAARVGKHTGAYRSWEALRARCLNPNNNRYKLYGGRGIKVCARWLHSFEKFLADMGERPERTTIERKDGNGNYCKENCRWATRSEQANNKRTNHKVTLDGARKTVAQWTAIKGLNPKTVASRITKGWPDEKLFTPVSVRHVKSAATRLLRHGPPRPKFKR